MSSPVASAWSRMRGQGPGRADQRGGSAAASAGRCPQGQPGGYGAGGGEPACGQVAVEPGQGGQAASDRAGREALFAVVQAHHVGSAGGVSLGSDELEDVGGGDLDGITVDGGEEDLQVVSGGEHRVGPASDGDETEIVVDEFVAEADFDTVFAELVAGQFRGETRHAVLRFRVLPRRCTGQRSQDSGSPTYPCALGTDLKRARTPTTSAGSVDHRPPCAHGSGHHYPGRD